jgi:phosphoesterase RecJ-like protein
MLEKRFLSKDGNTYGSRLERSLANELLKLKESKLIIDYSYKTSLMPGKDLFGDFLITLLTRSKFWLEIEKKENESKIQFYDNSKYFYKVIKSYKEISQLIKNINTWFSIPIENCIITSHKVPDGDAISSCRAVYNYIKSKGKRAVIRLEDDIPKNLQWIVEDIEIKNDIPKWAKNVIVLDSDCSENRLGWKIPNNLKVYNIDHHVYRINENDPENGIHVIDSCSTASILFKRFGIKDEILAVGVYTDTYFTKKVIEALTFISELGVSEKTFEEFLNKINYKSDKKMMKIIRDSKIHRCRNGFIIVETRETDANAIESAMHLLSELSESVCLIYGNGTKNVKLRTSNKSLDVSKIAKEYGGGGHSDASMISSIENVTDLKNTIIQFEVS